MITVFGLAKDIKKIDIIKKQLFILFSILMNNINHAVHTELSYITFSCVQTCVIIYFSIRESRNNHTLAVKNLSKLTRKQQSRSFIFNKVAGWKNSKKSQENINIKSLILTLFNAPLITKYKFSTLFKQCSYS